MLNYFTEVESGLYRYLTGPGGVNAHSRYDLLVASHIKPWRNSDNQQRLDVYNGLLLLPNFDKLFDKGYVSFDDNGKIIFSRYFWDLSEVVCFDAPIPCRGNTGMWQMPDALSRLVSAADEIARLGDFCVRTPEEAAKLFRAVLPVVGSSEGFFVLPLDESGHPKSMPVLVSLGTDSATTAVQLKDVFAEVFKADADRFVVAHNHPRGTLTPSPEDIRLTQSMKSAADALGLELLDHLILGNGNEFASRVGLLMR